MRKRIFTTALCMIAMGQAIADSVVVMQPLIAYSANSVAVVATPVLPVMSFYNDGQLLTFGGIILPQQSSATGIDAPTTAKPTVQAIAGGIVVNADDTDTPIAIYDAVGQQVHSSTLTANSTRISLPHAGIYLVKIGSQTVKVNIASR